MDSLTHVALGFGLAGLAYIDPRVAGNPDVASAVLACTLITQQAPDTDLVLRLGGNALYTKHHRGISHSLPFIPIWTFLTAAIVHAFNPNAPFWTLALWSFISVLVHIGSDIFNSYGTKALWPLHKKWIRLHVIPIFDPFLFALHAIAILIWKSGAYPPAPIFTGLYLIVVGYYAWRCLERADLRKQFTPADTLIPTFSWSIWSIMRARKDGGYQLGVYKDRKLTWEMHVEHDHHPAANVATQTKEVQALLAFSDSLCAQVESTTFGYRVRWVDVRFRFKQRLPFGATVELDENLQVLRSKISWK
jgi:inner membrane protein